MAPQALVSVSNTLHKFLAHTFQFIERNDHIGLCNISEKGLEQGHKLIREFSTRLSMSRKSDSLLGLGEVAMRLIVYSCPILNEIFVCSLCGEVWHQKNCRKNKKSDPQASIDKPAKYLPEIVSVSDE